MDSLDPWWHNGSLQRNDASFAYVVGLIEDRLRVMMIG